MITQGNPGYTLGFQNLGYFWQIIFVFHCSDPEEEL